LLVQRRHKSVERDSRDVLVVEIRLAHEAAQRVAAGFDLLLQ
jgi:hypothetical protein